MICGLTINLNNLDDQKYAIIAGWNKLYVSWLWNNENKISLKHFRDLWASTAPISMSFCLRQVWWRNNAYLPWETLKNVLTRCEIFSGKLVRVVMRRNRESFNSLAVQRLYGSVVDARTTNFYHVRWYTLYHQPIGAFLNQPSRNPLSWKDGRRKTYYSYF